MFVAAIYQRRRVIPDQVLMREGATSFPHYYVRLWELVVYLILIACPVR